MGKKMKKDQTIKSSFTFGIQQEDGVLNNLQGATCSQGKECLQICCAKQCKKHAIVCADNHCKCYKAHRGSKTCTFIYPQFIVKKIDQRNNSHYISNYIDKTLLKLIDQITQFREKLERKVKSLILTEKMKQFKQMSNKRNFKQLTGQAVSKVLEQFNQQSEKQSEDYAKNLRKKLETKWSRIEEPIKKQIFSLEKVIDQKVNIPFQNSRVLSNQEQRKRVAQFFPQSKREFESKLLYRASENNFSIEKFHEKCNGIAQTVTLVETQFNKVIGGYTPLTWKGGHHAVGYFTYQKDQSKESFVFSETNNDKFIITQNSQEQIAHYSQYGPIFCSGNGLADLAIGDKDRYNSCANIGLGYSNPKYKLNSKASWELFTGQTNKTCNFNPKQWQVYQLTF